jgi:Do/DeqQ family serine protease
MKPLLSYLFRFITLGLALAFLAVALRPELLPHRGAETAAGGADAVAERTQTPRNGGGAAAVRSYADAVARSSGAVVNIYTARVVAERALPRQFGNLFGEMWPHYRQRVERSLGSGVIIDDLGHVVTNNHVISDAASILVQLSDSRAAQAQVVGRDPDTDLAVLKVDLDSLPTMPLGRSDTLRVGDVVLAIGNPVGLSQTVTQGIVSATGRGLGVATFESFIQTDAAINVGNSGGALINTEGELVGINTAVFSRNAGIEGIGFAIPVNLVRGVMEEILLNGRVIRGWLGVVPDDLSPQQARAQGVQMGGGVLAADLYLNSPAYRAGVRPGDIITALDGEAMTNRQQALAYVAGLKPGGSVRIRGVRSGKPYEVTAEVIERPNQS